MYYPRHPGTPPEVRYLDPKNIPIKHRSPQEVSGCLGLCLYEPWSKLVVLGMAIPPLIGNPYNGYINPYCWVDGHPLLCGNNGSLDPSSSTYPNILVAKFVGLDGQKELSKVWPLGPRAFESFESSQFGGDIVGCFCFPKNPDPSRFLVGLMVQKSHPQNWNIGEIPDS